MRMGYTALGSGAAFVWNRYLPYKSSNGVLIPPIVLTAVVLASENVGDTEKDLAALSLGYLGVAQAISFSKASTPKPASESTATAPAPKENPSSELDAQANKLQKIREVTGTIGAIANLVGQFRGNT